MSALHRFWSTQPVTASSPDEEPPQPPQQGPLLGPHEVASEPNRLPDPYEWCTPVVSDEGERREIAELLAAHYVEDSSGSFRFAYTPEFLVWALLCPGHRPDWIVGVRCRPEGGATLSPGRLVGFVAGLPSTVRFDDDVREVCEINFLCVHRQLRGKRMAPVLIREVTRRVNLCGVWQAVYTAGVELPGGVVSRARYWHRPLQPTLLHQHRLLYGPMRVLAKPQNLERMYALAPAPNPRRLRPVTRADLPGLRNLLLGYWKTFRMAPAWESADDAVWEHWFLPRPGVVQAAVASDESGSAITDAYVYFLIPSCVVASNTLVWVAYAWCIVATRLAREDVVHEALCDAKSQGAHIFNALDVADHGEFLSRVPHFREGTGVLHYYLYNYQMAGGDMPPKDLAVVLP